MFILALQRSSVFNGRAVFGGSNSKFCLAEKKEKKKMREEGEEEGLGEI